jgi:hypothetical protein
MSIPTAGSLAGTLMFAASQLRPQIMFLAITLPRRPSSRIGTFQCSILGILALPPSYSHQAANIVPHQGTADTSTSGRVPALMTSWDFLPPRQGAPTLVSKV